MVGVLSLPLLALQSPPPTPFKPRLCPLTPPLRRRFHPKPTPLLSLPFSLPSFHKQSLHCSSSSMPFQLSSSSLVLLLSSYFLSLNIWSLDTFFLWEILYTGFKGSLIIFITLREMGFFFCSLVSLRIKFNKTKK